MLGISFNIEKNSETNTYTISRLDNVSISKNVGISYMSGDHKERWVLDLGETTKTLTQVNIDQVNQVLMALISLKYQGIDIGKVYIKTLHGIDYHISAMIKIGKTIGMNIEDINPKTPDELSQVIPKHFLGEASNDTCLNSFQNGCGRLISILE